MRHKPIKVDWDELEDAFNNQNEELVYYLDLITGHVVLDGEGEEGDFDEENGYYDPQAASTASEDDDTRAYVAPLDTQHKLEWMDAFLTENEAAPSRDERRGPHRGDQRHPPRTRRNPRALVPLPRRAPSRPHQILARRTRRPTQRPAPLAILTP